MNDNWFQLKNYHEWKNTDITPPSGIIYVWSDPHNGYVEAMYDPNIHNPDNGYTHWRRLLDKPLDPVDIQQVMVGVLEGKKYKRPTWYDPKRVYPGHWLKEPHNAKEDYTLSRVDIMATDWIEVE